MDCIGKVVGDSGMELDSRKETMWTRPDCEGALTIKDINSNI